MELIKTYDIVNADKTDTPFLAVYPHIVEENIRKLISFFKHTDQIRPHVKTPPAGARVPRVLNAI